MTFSLSPQQLFAQLQNDVSTCEKLLDLLGQEQEALAERNIEVLDTIIEHKTQQLEVLEKSAQLRTDWTRQSLGGATIDDSMIKERWQAIISSSEAPQISEQWEKLKVLQAKCKAANEVNGKILARNQKTFSRLLDIVRGQHSTPNLYSASGKSTGGHISHKVGEA